ncbi:hypothetical protein NP233_g4752 [Leucocoprinus birnbaumii]|uniref:Protein F37C4.5 n=1 Tax=Leucocoprinus birnbaumii TaxID=56174 RepID=A0AAD5VWF6_9AGAR|nr:hypothetical protein NP233_g4752 [Leucocoprinus birnbaumii]
MQGNIEIVASGHPVTSVMVLKSSKAEVSRKFDIIVKEGRNKLTITKLPTTINEHSVRLSLHNSDGTPTEDIYLSDTVCYIVDRPRDESSQSRLRALEIKKSGLQSEKKMLDTQAEVMVSYARSLTGQSTGTQDIDAFLNAFHERGRKNIESAMKIEEQISELDNQIQEERRKKTSIKGTLNTEMTIVITADRSKQIQLRLTYVVNNTKWTPAYELHAVTGEDGKPCSKVSLHYHASIKQATGEDWTGASLTLSTVSTDGVLKEVPALMPVEIYEQLPVVRGRHPRTQSRSPSRRHAPPIIIQTNRSRSYSRSARSLTSSPAHCSISNATYADNPGAVYQVHHGSTTFRVAPEFQASQEISPDDFDILSDDELQGQNTRTTRNLDLSAKQVTQTPMNLTYAVRGRADIPSDGKDHTVTIAILTFDADIEYVSIPRLDPRVFLQVNLLLVPYQVLGPVSVILDNNYVSSTRFSDVNRNDSFTFTLGDDPSISISYERLSKVTKEGTHTFAEPIDITTYTTSITVHNTHPFSIENFSIRDALPVSGNDKRIKVLLRKPKELVEAKEDNFVEVKDQGEVGDGNSGLQVKWKKEKEGIYEYRWKIGASGSLKLETVFDIKAPSDLAYQFSNFGINCYHIE